LKYSLWERRTYFVKAHRSGVRPEVMIAMKTQRELMGIRPIVQPDIMTEIEVVKKERRMLGDQWFDIAYMADTDGAIKLIKKMSRMDLEDFR